MKIFKFERTQILPISLEKAWVFFSNPLNLPQITPPSLGLCMKDSTDAAMYNGRIIEYSVKPLLGIQMTWVSEIKHLVEQRSFVDEQRSGPYKFWYHLHLFRPIGREKVEIIDVVHYALPLGILVQLFGGPIVSRKLEEIFNYRKEALEKKFSDKNKSEHL